MLIQWILRLFSDKQVQREYWRRHDAQAKLYNRVSQQDYLSAGKQLYCPVTTGMTYTEEEYQAELAKQQRIQQQVKASMSTGGDPFKWVPSPVQVPAVELAIPMLPGWGGVDNVDPDTLYMSEVDVSETPVVMPEADETEVIHSFYAGQPVRCVVPFRSQAGDILRLGHRYTVKHTNADGTVTLQECPHEGSFNATRFEPEE